MSKLFGESLIDLSGSAMMDASYLPLGRYKAVKPGYL